MNYWKQEAHEQQLYWDAVLPSVDQRPTNSKKSYLKYHLGEDYECNSDVIEENKIWW